MYSLHECYKTLTKAYASRRAAALGDLHKVLMHDKSAWTIFALARAGWMDTLLHLELSHLWHYNAALRINVALIGAGVGGHVQLARCIATRKKDVLSLDARMTCAWGVAMHGRLIDDEDMRAVSSVVSHDFAGAEAELAKLSGYKASQIRHCLQNEAALRGDLAVVKWVSKHTSYLPLERALFGGHARLGFLLRSARGEYGYNAESLLGSVCGGGNVRAASALMRTLASSTTRWTVIIGLACRELSLRILIWALQHCGCANRALPRTEYYEEHPCMSDERLSDAIQCVEFLLVYTRQPRFRRGRLLPFQEPRWPMSMRCAECLSRVLKRRLRAVS